MKYFISNLYDGGLSDEEIDENIIQYYKRVYNLKTELDFDNWSIKFIGDEQNILKYIKDFGAEIDESFETNIFDFNNKYNKIFNRKIL